MHDVRLAFVLAPQLLQGPVERELIGRRFPLRRSSAAGIAIHDGVVSHANTRHGAGNDIIVPGST